MIDSSPRPWWVRLIKPALSKSGYTVRISWAICSRRSLLKISFRAGAACSVLMAGPCWMWGCWKTRRAGFQRNMIVARAVVVQGLERWRSDDPDDHGVDLAGVAVAVRFLAGEAETVALGQLEMAFTNPQLEGPGQQVAGFFAVVAVALLAVGTRRKARVEHFQLAIGLRGQELVDDAVFVVHAQAAVLAHHVAVVLGGGDGFAGEEPLDGHAEAAGDIEQGRDRRVGEVAFQLADIAGGEFGLGRQFGQGHATPFAQAADTRTEKLRARGGAVTGGRWGVAHGLLQSLKGPQYKALVGCRGCDCYISQATFRPS